MTLLLHPEQLYALSPSRVVGQRYLKRASSIDSFAGVFSNSFLMGSWRSQNLLGVFEV